MSRLFTIEGLYYGPIKNEKNPTYFGNLEGCMKYADNSSFTRYGEDIVITTSGHKVAERKVHRKVDEIGEYFEYEDWKVYNHKM